MKKILVGLLAVFILFSVCGCASDTASTDTVYDDKEISRIESSCAEGFAPFQRSFDRIFDFETGSVTDIMIADEKDVPEDESSRYNTPVTVTTFGAEKAAEFIEKVKSLGFYTWKERYVTDEVIFDAAGSLITVYFSDGTVKSTYMFFKYPPKYEEIETAFEDYLGAELYCDW